MTRYGKKIGTDGRDRFTWPPGGDNKTNTMVIRFDMMADITIIIILKRCYCGCKANDSIDSLEYIWIIVNSLRAMFPAVLLKQKLMWPKLANWHIAYMYSVFFASSASIFILLEQMSCNIFTKMACYNKLGVVKSILVLPKIYHLLDRMSCN